MRKNITVTAVTEKRKCQQECALSARWLLPWGTQGTTRVALCPQHAHEQVVVLMKLEEKQPVTA